MKIRLLEVNHHHDILCFVACRDISLTDTASIFTPSIYNYNLHSPKGLVSACLPLDDTIATLILIDRSRKLTTRLLYFHKVLDH